MEFSLISRLPPDSLEQRWARTMADALSRQGHLCRWAGNGLPSLFPHRASDRLTVQLGSGRRIRADVLLTAAWHWQPLQVQWPPPRRATLLAIADSPLAQKEAPSDVAVIPSPYPIPEMFYAPGDAKLVTDITHQLRLQRRPRILYIGSYDNGQALTQIFDAARQLLAHDGELILIGGLAIRAQMAPVVHRLGLAETVVFAPLLDDPAMAGLIHSADVLVCPQSPVQYPFWLTYAQAAALPTVALHTPYNAVASGNAAILVDPHQPTAWAQAIHEALTNEAIRRAIMRRAQNWSQVHRADDLVPLWTDLCRRIRGT